MRTSLRLGVSVLCLLGGAVGCAGDYLTDTARPERLVADGEPLSAPKSDALLRMAQTTAARGDWPMAATLFRRAYTLNPDNFDAAYGLGLSLNRLGANNEALEAYQAALKLRKDDVDALRGLGNTLIMLDRPAHAIPQFERALNHKKDPRLINSMAVAYDLLDDYKAAQACYRVGLDVAPKDISLRNNFGLSMMLSRDYDNAVKELRQVIAMPGAHVRHRLNLALALVLAGDTKTAEGVARFDLDATAARDQIAYFETIKALNDSKEARAALRAHIRGDGTGFTEFMKQRKAAATDKMKAAPKP